VDQNTPAQADLLAESDSLNAARHIDQKTSLVFFIISRPFFIDLILDICNLHIRQNLES
jgi:hypothetical protein